MFFIGSASDEEIINICDNIKQAARSFEPFDLEFNRIAFSPNQKMIWATGKKSRELANLKSAIEKQLMDLRESEKQSSFSPFLNKGGEEKGINPHITLGRIYASEWKKLENLPIINEKISFFIPVVSIEIVESKLAKEGSEYSVLESAEL